MPILDLLGIYFDAVVVFVRNSSLFFRLAMAILCRHLSNCHYADKNHTFTKQRGFFWLGNNYKLGSNHHSVCQFKKEFYQFITFYQFIVSIYFILSTYFVLLIYLILPISFYSILSNQFPFVKTQWNFYTLLMIPYFPIVWILRSEGYRNNDLMGRP